MRSEKRKTNSERVYAEIIDEIHELGLMADKLRRYIRRGVADTQRVAIETHLASLDNRIDRLEAQLLDMNGSPFANRAIRQRDKKYPKLTMRPLITITEFTAVEKAIAA